jgi:hypothetical protein
MAAVPGILRKWNPGIVPGLSLWVDGQDNSSITMANTSNISAISDKSGLNIQLVQDVEAFQPVLTSNVNTLQTIGFNGIHYMSTTTSFFPSLFNNTSNISQFTVFTSRNIVATQAITSIADTAFNTAGSNFSLGLTPNNLRLFKNAGGPNLSASPNLSNVLIEGFIENNTNLRLNLTFNNTNATAVTTTPTLNNLSQFFIGRRPGASILNGDIGEILFYNSNAYNNSSPFNPQIEGYLAWKWGLQNSLPNIHPYRRRPPS